MLCIVSKVSDVNEPGLPKARHPAHALRLIGSTLALGGVLSVLGFWYPIGPSRLATYQQIAIWYCAAVTLATLFWTTGGVAARFPVFATLTNVSWRIFTIAGFALVVSATKWPQGNSLCLYLVGYYFPFVVLESCLSIFHLQTGRKA